jgi:hypothetical protein
MISVLFAARDSVYKTIDGLDVWDEERNALLWPGGNPGIFHPPCRLWSAFLHQFSTAPQSEKKLAFWSVEQIRRWGGVLEHPAFSNLWDAAHLPSPGQRDSYGFTISIDQFWFGHQCRKRTWIYCCGIARSAVPAPPIRLVGQYPVALHTKQRVPKRDKYSRSATPFAFAQWLVETAEAVK